jgi:DNA-directed RNA polymerase specialized sigma subunit
MLGKNLSKKKINALVDFAMLQLQKDDYEIINGLFFRHMTVYQLTKELGIPRSTVRYRRDKALKQLKKIILKNQMKKLAK